MDFLTSQTSRVLAKAMDGLYARHTAIASNLANAETPGYQAREVLFEENLKQAIQAENHGQQASRFLPPGSLKVTSQKHYNPNPIPGNLDEARAQVERSQFQFRMDNNGVDVESQMAKLTRNSGKYQVLARLESKEFAALRGIIKGGQ